MLICFYQCRTCGHEFDTMRSLGDVEENAECPRCGSGSIKRMAVIAASCSGALKSSPGPLSGQNS